MDASTAAAAVAMLAMYGAAVWATIKLSTGNQKEERTAAVALSEGEHEDVLLAVISRLTELYEREAELEQRGLGETRMMEAVKEERRRLERVQKTMEETERRWNLE